MSLQEISNNVSLEELCKLLNYFSSNTFRGKNKCKIAEQIQDKCVSLLEIDNKGELLINEEGVLCSHYPTKIFIDRDFYCNSKDRNEVEKWERHKELVQMSRVARARSRFSVPVIFFKGKMICRSATLASSAELYGRSGMDYLFTNKKKSDDDKEAAESTNRDILSKARKADIDLLKECDVHYIADLMVEQKKVKFGLYITSSEKIDKENRYRDFKIVSMPYPGCETFRELKQNKYSAENVYFDWNQLYVDAKLCIPEDIPLPSEVIWNEYQVWDLVTLTKNYLLILLYLLKEGSGNILVHCISGWDRTPLFISLLRLSLWADGLLHPSLSSHQLLYLTIAYDWLLFGHDLQDRLLKGEEIFFFTFDFLTYISSKNFSLHDARAVGTNVFAERTKRLESIRTTFHSVYIETIGLSSSPAGQTDGIIRQVTQNMNSLLAGFASKVMNVSNSVTRR